MATLWAEQILFNFGGSRQSDTSSSFQSVTHPEGPWASFQLAPYAYISHISHPQIRQSATF